MKYYTKKILLTTDYWTSQKFESSLLVYLFTSLLLYLFQFNKKKEFPYLFPKYKTHDKQTLFWYWEFYAKEILIESQCIYSCL